MQEKNTINPEHLGWTRKGNKYHIRESVGKTDHILWILRPGNGEDEAYYLQKIDTRYKTFLPNIIWAGQLDELNSIMDAFDIPKFIDNDIHDKE